MLIQIHFLSLLLFLSTHCYGSMTVIYPKQGIKDDTTGYPVELLRLAIDRAGTAQNIFLQPSNIEVLQSRVLKLIEQNVVIDVAWSMTNKMREASLRAIKVPLYKGLYGYRVLLINKQQQDRFNKALSLAELQQEMLGVQGHDWPDLTILRFNGFNLTSSSSYKGLFEMLSLNRVDYFPRSVLEAWREEEQFSELGLVVEPNLLLHYPAAVYYFVNKSNEELATIIESGLKAAVADGSFDLLFETVQMDYLARSNLKNRRVLKLKNPQFDQADIGLLTSPEVFQSQ